MKSKIVFAPIHYVLDAQNSGSEFYWSYKIFEGISKVEGDRAWFIAGGLRGIDNGHVIDCGIFRPEELKLSLLNIYRFYFKIYFQIQKLKRFLGDKFILHHVLPFSIGSSFNIYALQSKQPFILGPLQSPLTVTDSDLDHKNARGFRKSDKGVFDFFRSAVFILMKPFLNFLSSRTLMRADKIVAINIYTRDMLVKRGVKIEIITIIPPGIDIVKFQCFPYEEKTAIPTEFISVGYLLQRKGVDLLIQALKEVVKVNENVRLRIVGDGPQREALEKLVKELNVSDYVVFEGFVPNSDVQKYYQKAHIFVSMSRSESWGQMYLEAMACGLPVISSKNVGSESIIHDSEFGYLVAQEDVNGLAEKMVYLIEHPDMIASFGKKARQEVEEKYDWDKVIIPQYLELYNEMKK